MRIESEPLTGLSDSELDALAEVALAPSAQARLNELLARNATSGSSDDDQSELDRLLRQVDASPRLIYVSCVANAPQRKQRHTLLG